MNRFGVLVNAAAVVVVVIAVSLAAVDAAADVAAVNTIVLVASKAAAAAAAVTDVGLDLEAAYTPRTVSAVLLLQRDRHHESYLPLPDTGCLVGQDYRSP